MGMDHVVYLDAKAREEEKLVDGSKTMIIRGAAGRKMPYGRVKEKDVLYFINNNGEGNINAKSIVKSVFNSVKMDKEASIALVDQHQTKLNLTEKQYQKWAGKRYLVLIEIEDFEKIEPFKLDKRDFGNMDDWLPVEDILRVKIN